MTVGRRNTTFLSVSLPLFVALAMLPVAACSGTASQDTVPTQVRPLPAPGSTSPSRNSANASPEQTASQRPVRPQGQGVVNTGTFPNLNIRPQVAAEQISPERREQLFQDLSATRSRVASSSGSSGAIMDANSMRQVGAAHGDAALRQIEVESAD